MNKKELEIRVIAFTVSVIKIMESLPDTKTMNYFSGQLLRSAGSVSLNYGEAQSGESRRDFIHKLKIVLKELRETFMCLNILQELKVSKDGEMQIMDVILESNELISIFVKSVQTAQKNDQDKMLNRKVS